MNALGIILLLAPLVSDDYCTAELDYLLALHDEFGLPHPPERACLVRYTHLPDVSFDQGKRITRRYDPALGFSHDGRTVINYNGDSVEVESIATVKPDPTVHGDTIPDDLVDALRFHARGWTALSRAVYRRWLLEPKSCVWNGPEDDLAHRAYEHWSHRISSDPGTSLPVILKYMKRLVPSLKGDGGYARDLVRGMELATKPRNSPVGSDDALIDALLGLNGVAYGWNHELRGDPCYRAIVRRGLDIVPALIAHLDDERLTRTYFYDQGHCSIQDLVMGILKDLAGESFALPDTTRDERLEAIGKWFSDAHKLGEEKYVTTRILGASDGDVIVPRFGLFLLLMEKYPERTAEVYRKIIGTRPGHNRYAGEYARAVAEGPLPPADKWTILKYAATQKQPDHRAAGIDHLRSLDPKLAKELLLADLAKVSTDPTEADGELVRIAAEGGDPEEWAALALAVRHADVAGRGRLIQEIARTGTSAGRKHRIAFFAECLTDTDVCEQPDNFLWITRIEVRNFAALHLRQVFEIGGELPGDDWTPAQWAVLREKVRARVKDELRR